MVKDGEDFILGFEGHPWHTHGDILSKMSGLPIEVAVGQFIDALLNSRSAVAIARVDGVIRDVWIAELPLRSDPFKPENETVSYRYWDGRVPN